MILEEAKSVRICVECRAKIYPKVLCLKVKYLDKCRFSKTEYAFKFSNFCLNCAEGPAEDVFSLKREKLKILNIRNTNNNLKILIQTEYEKFLNYKKYLKIIRNWKIYFKAIIEKGAENPPKNNSQ